MVLKGKNTVVFTIVVLAVFLFANCLHMMQKERQGEAYALPLAIGDWKGSELQYDHKLLTTWLGTENILFRRYENTANGYAVTIYVAYYSSLESSDMAHDPEVCYPGQGWEITSNSDIKFILSGKDVRIKRMSIRKGSDQEVVYSWWETKNRIVPYSSWYHLAQILNKLSFQDTSSIWVRISAQSVPGKMMSCPGEETVRDFCEEAGPLFANYFLSGS